MSFKTDRDKTAHLLRRFGLGASEAELDYYGSDGLAGAIGKLLDCELVAETFDPDVELFSTDKNQLKVQSVQAWWMAKLLTTRRPLIEKMTLFWHDHFATSAQKVTNGPLLHQQNELIRANAIGSFRELLRAVSKDPAMLVWLDNQFNVKGKPNENFAREVMELFTLGIGNYSEKDVQEAARAFTGWTFRGATREKLGKYRKSTFYFDSRKHDSEIKEVLGSKGPFDGDGVLNLLCDEPQTARYIVTKIWEWFAYSKPEPGLVERLSASFRKSGLDLKGLLRSIMESPEFYSDKAERSVYKNPVDFVVPPLRQLGVGALLSELKPNADGLLDRKQLGPVLGCVQSTKSMGMNLLFPPDVAGWEGGQYWISSATMIERIRWADRIFGLAPAKGVAPTRISFAPIFEEDPSPRGVVEKLISVFDAPIPVERRAPLIAAAEKAVAGGLTAQTANKAAGAVARLIFGSPEFQMA